MASVSVESRLEELEATVARLKNDVDEMRSSRKDWRRTIGAFTDDDGMKELLQEASALREADRKSNAADAD